MIAATYVGSSNLDCIGYQRGTVYVRFVKGGCYSYDKVPFNLYQDLLNAESVGQFFHQHVRTSFEYKRLDFDPFVKQEELV